MVLNPIEPQVESVANLEPEPDPPAPNDEDRITRLEFAVENLAGIVKGAINPKPVLVNPNPQPQEPQPLPMTFGHMMTMFKQIGDTINAAAQAHNLIRESGIKTGVLLGRQGAILEFEKGRAEGAERDLADLAQDFEAAREADAPLDRLQMLGSKIFQVLQQKGILPDNLPDITPEAEAPEE